LFRAINAEPLVKKLLHQRNQWAELPHGLELKQTWSLFWSSARIELDLLKLMVFQKVNHLPGASQLTNPFLLKRNLQRAMRASLKASKEFDIMPLTFVLPREYVEFLTVFTDLEEQEGSQNVWLMKAAIRKN